MRKYSFALLFIVLILFATVPVTNVSADVHEHQFVVTEQNESDHILECAECGFRMYQIHGSCDPDATECAVCHRDRNDCAEHWCGWLVDHISDGPFLADNWYHWQICSVCQAGTFGIPHTTVCTDPNVCIECGYYTTTGIVTHNTNMEEWSADDFSHWHACLDCGEGYHEIHSDFDEDGICDVCQHVAMKCPGHQFEVSERKSWCHYLECSICHYKISQDHGSCDPEATTCAGCGMSRDDCEPAYWQVDHIPAGPYYSDITSHWQFCTVCHEECRHISHSSDCRDADRCVECQLTMEDDGIFIYSGDVMHHDAYMTEDCSNDYVHWYICPTCNQQVNKERHEDYDGEGYCHVCGHLISVCEEHQFVPVYTDPEHHILECTNCLLDIYGIHGNCIPGATECAECGQARDECLSWSDDHQADGAYSYDSQTHQATCSVCGEEFSGNHCAFCFAPEFCMECGYSVSEDHIEINQFLHDMRYESWCADDYSHWGECYDCGKIADFWPHNDNNGDGYCDQEYCGHIMPEEEPDIRPLPVRMGQSEADVFKGDQLRLVIRGLPDGVTQEGASWSSSDPSIVTVDENGIILITGAGKATVKAVLSDGLETYCRLTAYSHVEDIRATVDRSQICKIGDTLNLNVIFTPEHPKLESCTFSSSNENVATVSENGVITCVGTGAAVITVVPVDNGSMSAKVAIVCPGTNTFTVPSNLKQIDAEAFSRTGIEYVILNDGTAMIGDLAFADCNSLYAAVIPDTVEFISEDAFADCGTVVIITPEGSYASQYAEQHMLPVIHP